MLELLAASIITVYPVTDTERDGVPDAVDNCIFFRNPDQGSCEDAGAIYYLDAYAQVESIDGEPVLVFRQLWEPAAPSGDADGDGVADPLDACVYVYGNDPALCNYDLNGDGVMTDADRQVWRTLKHSTGPAGDFNGDGIVSKPDRRILNYAIKKGITKGVGCDFTPDVETFDLNGVSVCTGITKIELK